MYPWADPLDAHTTAVGALGIEPPPAWTELLARLQAYTDLDSPTADRLAAAVIDGDRRPRSFSSRRPRATT